MKINNHTIYYAIRYDEEHIRCGHFSETLQGRSPEKLLCDYFGYNNSDLLVFGCVNETLNTKVFHDQIMAFIKSKPLREWFYNK